MDRFIIYASLVMISLTSATEYESQLGTFNIYMNDKLYSNQELAQAIVAQTDNLINDLGHVSTSHYNIYIYDNNKQFHQSCSYIQGWESGLAIKKKPETIIIKGPEIQTRGISQFIKVLEHELSHIYLFRRIESLRLPDWFEEGFAMYIAKEFNINKKILISEAYWKSSTLTENELNNFRNISRSRIPLCYAESAAFFEYIVQDGSIKEILDSIASSNDFRIGLERAIGMPYAELVYNYNNSIITSYRWYILIRFSRYIFYITPFILTIGYFVTRKRNKNTLDKWEIEEIVEDTDWSNHAES